MTFTHHCHEYCHCHMFTQVSTCDLWHSCTCTLGERTNPGALIPRVSLLTTPASRLLLVWWQPQMPRQSASIGWSPAARWSSGPCPRGRQSKHWGLKAVSVTSRWGPDWRPPACRCDISLQSSRPQHHHTPSKTDDYSSKWASPRGEWCNAVVNTDY